MATVITYNDFRYGMVSEYMRRRADLALYQKSASLIENAVPMRTGGVRLRSGTVRIADVGGLNAVRIFPLVISVREHYLLVLSPTKLYIFGLGLSGTYENLSGEGFATEYSEQEIPEIQIAYNYERAILVQRNHSPIVVEKSTSGGWSVGQIALDATTDAFNYTYDDEGNESKSALQYDYKGLFTENNFPSVAAFHANRLWLGASSEHPYRLWASKPFEYNNFQTEDYYNTVNEGVSVDQYMDAIAGSGETREELSDGNFWIVTKTVYPSTGLVVVISVIQDSTGAVVGHKEYDTETDSWGPPIFDGEDWRRSYKYTKAVMELDSVVREDSAMMLDMASDRDETISWLASTEKYILVGTASSEWVMPSSINALSQTISKTASYGAAPFLQSCYGVRNIFYVQSGGKLLRSVYTTEDGTSFLDLTYQCSDILSSGVKEMAWQRVPEPRLYCVLKDGTMAVLCYDDDYDVNAWCIWKSEVLFKSVAVVDTEDGQEVFVLADSPDNGMAILRFKDGVFTDDASGEFVARVRTNNLDSASTMLYSKKSFRVAADSMHTRFKTRINGRSPSVSYSYDKDLIKLWNWTDPTDAGLRAEFESFPGEDMVLLSVMVETEVSD